jgi:hypothetical protein
MKRVRKAIVTILAALYVGSIIFLGCLDDYYYRTRPRQPDPASGRVFPEHVKGTVGSAPVYLTRTEIFPYQNAEYFWLGLFGAVVLLAYRREDVG